MKKSLLKITVSDSMYNLFTKTAENSSSRCPFFIHQEPKIPECLLKKEVNEANK